MSAVCSEGNVLDSPIHLEITYPLFALLGGGGREGRGRGRGGGGREGEGRGGTRPCTCPSQLKQQVHTVSTYF